jgi:hypothetical protein
MDETMPVFREGGALRTPEQTQELAKQTLRQLRPDLFGGDEPRALVGLTADELLLLRVRLVEVHGGERGTVAVDHALDAKLFQAQQELKQG